MTRIRLARLFPFLRWFPVQGATLRSDLIAGVTVAMVIIPQAMAYAGLAGLSLAIALALMVGALQLALASFKLGDLVSRPGRIAAVEPARLELGADGQTVEKCCCRATACACPPRAAVRWAAYSS